MVQTLYASKQRDTYIYTYIYIYIHIYIHIFVAKPIGTFFKFLFANDSGIVSIRKNAISSYLFFPVPVCAITASGVPDGTLVSMNRFSTLFG
jgi:hypothetical protein